MSLVNIGKFTIAVIVTIVFIVIIGYITKAAYQPIKSEYLGYNLPVPEKEQTIEETQEQATNEQTEQTEQPAQAEQASTAEQNIETSPAQQLENSEQVADKTASETPSLASLLANGDATAGEKLAKKCISCHSLTPDLKIKVGPPLYGIVGLPVAHTEDYKYSDNLKQLKEEGKVWDFENLDIFIKKPKDFAPKTKMTFPGIKSDEDRANLILYLRSLSDNPVPLPAE